MSFGRFKYVVFLNILSRILSHSFSHLLCGCHLPVMIADMLFVGIFLPALRLRRLLTLLMVALVALRFVEVLLAPFRLLFGTYLFRVAVEVHASCLSETTKAAIVENNS